MAKKQKRKSLAPAKGRSRSFRKELATRKGEKLLVTKFQKTFRKSRRSTRRQLSERFDEVVAPQVRGFVKRNLKKKRKEYILRIRTSQYAGAKGPSNIYSSRRVLITSGKGLEARIALLKDDLIKSMETYLKRMGVGSVLIRGVDLEATVKKEKSVAKKRKKRARASSVKKTRKPKRQASKKVRRR